MAESRKDALIARLSQMAGTPSEMAAVAGVEMSDRTFQRAIKELVESGVLIAEGTTHDRRYRNKLPAQKIASGYGAAIEMGIAGPLKSAGSKARTDAFARMGAAATRKTGTIGAGKAPGEPVRS